MKTTIETLEQLRRAVVRFKNIDHTLTTDGDKLRPMEPDAFEDLQDDLDQLRVDIFEATAIRL